MGKMYSEFCDMVAGEIAAYLPDGYDDAEIMLQEIVKNNDSRHVGISIKKGNVSPIIYLEVYYNRYLDGEPVEKILSNISDAFVASQREFNLPDMTNWNKVKGMVYPRLSSGSGNAEFLKGKPSQKFKDMVVTYYIRITEDGTATTAVTDSMFKLWGITFEELDRVAIKNAELDTKQFSLSNIVPADMPELCEVEMYVLTNNTGMFGAASILSDNTLSKIREKIGDFYILPSSIHETLILPKTGDDSEALRDLVKSVNGGGLLSPEEILSNNVYTYAEGVKMCA